MPRAIPDMLKHHADQVARWWIQRVVAEGATVGGVTQAKPRLKIPSISRPDGGDLATAIGSQADDDTAAGTDFQAERGSGRRRHRNHHDDRRRADGCTSLAFHGRLGRR